MTQQPRYAVRSKVAPNSYEVYYIATGVVIARCIFNEGDKQAASDKANSICDDLNAGRRLQL